MASTLQSGQADPSPRNLSDVTAKLGEPYIVASSVGAARTPNPAPDWAARAPLHHLDPLLSRNAEFIASLQRLQETLLGPRGLALPKWALYDCGELPGAAVGFARRADRLSADLRATLSMDDSSRELIPVSMVILIPMLARGCWHTYALSCIDQPGLRECTLALGLSLIEVTTAHATAEWGSPELAAYARFAPLELLTARTPAHTNPSSLTFRFRVTSERITDAIKGRAGRELDAEATWIARDDLAAQLDVQRALQSGQRRVVLGAPRLDDGVAETPIGVAR